MRFGSAISAHDEDDGNCSKRSEKRGLSNRGNDGRRQLETDTQPSPFYAIRVCAAARVRTEYERVCRLKMNTFFKERFFRPSLHSVPKRPPPRSRLSTLRRRAPRTYVAADVLPSLRYHIRSDSISQSIHRYPVQRRRRQKVVRVRDTREVDNHYPQYLYIINALSNPLGVPVHFSRQENHVTFVHSKLSNSETAIGVSSVQSLGMLKRFTLRWSMRGHSPLCLLHYPPDTKYFILTI